MDRLNEFQIGFATGMVVLLALLGIGTWYSHHEENSGYEDKMVISYHCPNKTYERELFRKVLNTSGIQTHFANQEMSMDKHVIKIRLTNPKNTKD